MNTTTSAVIADLESEVRHWRREAGRLACKFTGVGPTGGFCMTGKPNDRHINYCLPAGLAARLGRLFNRGSVLDLGCGRGQYGTWFKTHAPMVRWVGVDGAEGIEEFSGGLIRFADLSSPLPWSLRTLFDWKMAIEVAEHLPRP